MDPHKRIKIRHLQNFLEVAQQRSVMKAALSLSITQPAVSKTLRELEEILEVKLFDRSKRGFSLTRFGEVFLRFASASVTALKQGIDSIDQVRIEEGPRIRVGALPTSAARILPNALQIFKKDRMNAIVEVVTGANDVMLSQLRLGDLDLVIGRLADPSLLHGLTFEHLYTENIAFIVRSEHPLLMEDEPFELEKLQSYPVLYPNSGSIIRPIIDRFLVTSGMSKFKNRIETVSMSFGRAYTLTTDCVWIISSGVVAPDLNSGSLRELPIDTSDLAGPAGITTRQDIAPNLPTQILMQALRDSVSGSLD